MALESMVKKRFDFNKKKTVDERMMQVEIIEICNQGNFLNALRSRLNFTLSLLYLFPNLILSWLFVGLVMAVNDTFIKAVSIHKNNNIFMIRINSYSLFFLRSKTKIVNGCLVIILFYRTFTVTKLLLRIIKNIWYGNDYASISLDTAKLS